MHIPRKDDKIKREQTGVESVFPSASVAMGLKQMNQDGGKKRRLTPDDRGSVTG